MDSLSRYLSLSASEKLKSKQLLEDLLRCMVCYERYQEPKVLQCQHTFCLSCLKRWSHQGGNGVNGLSCPTCRVRTPLVCSADLSRLPSDFKVTKLDELLKQVMVKQHRDRRTCDICVAMGTTRNASHFCADCTESFCSGCCDKHSTNSLFGDHHMVDLSSPDMASKLFCREHLSKSIKYLCVECSTFICTVCAINSHREHHAQDLQTGLQGYTSHLREQLALVSDLIYALQAAHEDLREAQIMAKALHEDIQQQIDDEVSGRTQKIVCCKNDMLEHISAKLFRPSVHNISWAIKSLKDRAMNAVDEHTDMIINSMNDQRKELINSLQEKHDALSSKFIENIEQVSFHIASIDSLKSYVTSLLGLNNSMEILIVYEELSARIQSVLEDTDVEAMTRNMVNCVTYEPTFGDSSIGSLVEIEMSITQYISRNSQHAQQSAKAEASACAALDDELEVADLIDIAAESGSECQDNSVYSSDTASTTASTTASAILEESYSVRSNVLPSASLTPESTISDTHVDALKLAAHSEDDLTYGDTFSRADPLRQTVSFPINSEDVPPLDNQEPRPRAYSVTAAIENGEHDVTSTTAVESNSLPTRGASDVAAAKSRQSKPQSAGLSRPMSALEPFRNGSLDDYQEKHQMKRSASETAEQSSDSLIPIKLADLSNPDITLKLIWEKEGHMKSYTGTKKSYGSSGGGAKRKMSLQSSYGSNPLGMPEVRNPTDLLFMSDNELIVADSGDRNLQFMTADYKMWSKVKDRRQPFVTVRPLTWGQMEPSCIVHAPDEFANASGNSHKMNRLDPKNTVVVTDYKDKCVKVVDVRDKGTCVATWGKGGFFSTSKFKQPSGIAITKDEKWIISDVAKHTVTVHDRDGRCLLQFGTRGKGGYGFEQPRYVLVDQHDRILVSDSGNGGVKVFDKNGLFLQKIGHRDKSSLTYPMGICQDLCGNLLVADKLKDAVCVFSQDGRFVRELQFDDCNLKHPTGIAVCANGQMAVTQTDTPAVKMYTMHKSDCTSC